MTWRWIARAVAMGMVAGAIGDPGCVRLRPPAITVVTAPGATAARKAAVEAAVGAAGHETSAGRAGARAVRVAAGSPSDILALHRDREVDIVVRPSVPEIVVTDVVVPASTMVGLTTTVRVGLEGATDGAAVQVRVLDATTRQLIGTTEAEGSAAGKVWAEIPVIATRAGTWRLCLEVEAPDAPRMEQACDAVADLRVQSDRVRIDVLEGRPGWAGRFARLALEGWDAAEVRSEVRVAPSVRVSTRPAARQQPPVVADVMVVAGLDGLDARDIARVRAALDRGTTVILQADGPVPRSLHDLWPDAPSRVISGATPRTLTLGVHRWIVREWLAPAAGPPHQTTLASLDGDPPVPAIVARAVGAGRVVLVAALDAWRWRLDDSASFEPAWQALVGSLALHGPGAAPAAWRVPAPLGDEVHVATGWSRGALTDDDVAVSSAALTVVGGDDVPRLAALVGPRDGVRRAAWRTVASPDWLEVSLLPSADVGAAGPSVIQVGPRSRLPASWDDVVRVIVGSGGMVVTLEDLPAALDRRTRLDAGRPVHWWLTRQWWYAALVIVLLGGEWWMRRLLREP